MKLGPLSFSWRWSLFLYRGPVRDWYGLFRNGPGIIPGRWGFFALGLEFGSRNPGNRIGTWIKMVGLWPW